METNFKVDVPSFALGYSVGKKKVPPSQEKEVTIKSNGKTEILPDEKQLLSKVTVNTNVELGFNIAYGTEPPEDTSKLWVKTEQPASNVIVSLDEVWEDGNRPDSISKFTSFSGNYGGACRVGSYVYLFGGDQGTVGSSAIKRVNLETKEYKTLTAAITDGVRDIACGAVGKKIYLFGGRDGATASTGKAISYVFDTETEEIEGTIAPHYYSNTTKGVFGSGCVVNGSNIHLIGGGYGNSSTERSEQHKIYNFSTNTYTNVRSMPVKRHSMACVLVDGCIYIFGGEYGSEGKTEIYKYAIEENAYEKLPVELPNGVLRVAACVWGRRIYLFGGRSNQVTNAIKYDTILYYDLDTRKLVECEAKLTTASSAAGAFSDGDNIFVFPDDTSCNIYQPRIGYPTLENNVLHIIPNSPDNVFPIMVSGKTRIEVNAGDAYIGNANNEAEPVETALYKDGEWQTI